MIRSNPQWDYLMADKACKLADQAEPWVENKLALRGGNMTKTERLAWIRHADYEALLRKWRFEPAGSPWFQGEVFTSFMLHLELQYNLCHPEQQAAISKRVGFNPKADWGGPTMSSPRRVKYKPLILEPVKLRDILKMDGHKKAPPATPAWPKRMGYQPKVQAVKDVIKAFKQGGRTSHSSFGLLLPYVIAYCEEQKLPYTVNAHPGVGYQITLFF